MVYADSDLEYDDRRAMMRTLRDIRDLPVVEVGR
jgi:hypothetical protein